MLLRSKNDYKGSSHQHINDNIWIDVYVWASCYSLRNTKKNLLCYYLVKTTLKSGLRRYDGSYSDLRKLVCLGTAVGS